MMTSLDTVSALLDMLETINFSSAPMPDNQPKHEQDEHGDAQTKEVLILQDADGSFAGVMVALDYPDAAAAERLLTELEGHPLLYESGHGAVLRCRPGFHQTACNATAIASFSI